MRENVKFWAVILSTVLAIGLGLAGGFLVDPEDVFISYGEAYAQAHPEAAQAAPQWVCGPNQWQAGQRAPNFSGDLAAAGEAVPPGGLAVITSDTRAREFRLWLYDGDDTYLTVKYDQVAIEAGTDLPTGRIDPIGKPILIYDQGMLKLLFVAWNGGDGSKPQPLIRVYLWCGLR